MGGSITRLVRPNKTRCEQVWEPGRKGLQAMERSSGSILRTEKILAEDPTSPFTWGFMKNCRDALTLKRGNRDIS